MTREEVLSVLLSDIKSMVPKEQYTIEDVKSCVGEKPDADISCYIACGNSIMYGAFLGGNFYQYAVRNGVFTEPILLLYTPDWYVMIK